VRTGLNHSGGWVVAKQRKKYIKKHKKHTITSFWHSVTELAAASREGLCSGHKRGQTVAKS
jgi:hypothetical protein